LESRSSDVIAVFSGEAYRRKLLILIVLCVLALFVSAVFVQDTTVAFLFVVGIFSLLVVLVPLVVVKQYFILEPMVFVCLSVLMGFTLKTFYVVSEIDRSAVVQKKLMDGLPVDGLTWASMVLLIGLMMFAIGYSLSRGAITAHGQIKNRLSEAKLLLFSILILFLCLVSFFIFFKTSGFIFNDVSDLSQKRFSESDGGRLSNLNYYLYRVVLFCKAPMYFLFFIIISGKRSGISVFGVLFFIALFLNLFVTFFVSNKAGVVLPFADLLVMYMLMVGKIDFRKLLSIGFIVVVLIGMIASFRGGDAVADYSFLDKIFGGRYFVDVTKTAHIINAFPSPIEYFYGKSLIGWVNVILPESLRLDSIYFSGLGQYLGQYVFGYAASGVPPGIIAEFYINFGMAGVVIGMFIVGMLLKRIHIFLFSRVNHVLFLICYAIVTVRVPIFLFNNGVSVALLKTAADVMIVCAFYILVKRRLFATDY